MRACMAKTRTVVWPRLERSLSLDSARSEADAAATGNSPPQPKPKSACAAVRKANTVCALGPSAAVSSTPAAHQKIIIDFTINCAVGNFGVCHCYSLWHLLAAGDLTNEHDQSSGDRSPLAANPVHNKAQGKHPSAQAGHL